MMDIEISKEDILKPDNVELRTPIKSKQQQLVNQTKKNQTSPYQMHQIQEFILMWMEQIKKYNDDPDVILMMHQMNEVLQTSDQASSQKQFNYTPKQQNNDESSFNSNFKQDMLQKMNDRVMWVSEEIQNQVCQSPKTVEHGKYFNETCSEITQQVNKKELEFQNKNDDEFCKEFDQCKSKFSGSPLNLQSHKKSGKFDDANINQVLSFRKKQQKQIKEFKNSLTEMKKVVGYELQKEITIFKEDFLSEHSKFSKSYSELQDQVNTYQEMFSQSTLKIQKLEQIIQDLKQQLEAQQSDSNSEQFIFQLAGFIQSDKIENNNIEDAKTKIMEYIMTQSQQVQGLTKQLQMTQQNNQIMIQRLENDNQLNKNRLGTEKQMLEFQIMTLNNTIQQQDRNYQQLNQELEQLRLCDQMATNQELVKKGYIQMKQQQQLIYIAATILQQFINSTVFQLNVAETLQEQIKQLKLNEEEVLKQITTQKEFQETTMDYFNNNQETIQHVIQILCTEYTKVINNIINQRIELQKQLC
ncbi:unnamed protein product (macronuclear) [Paramecium tetraurelia]|uniref:Uncharacterized protein n=1 Tax=Paramecium tetraurelia TaxID=5888 RepID=A0DGE3_PARTE|nr:uncharacterized protein GSPATT00002239001 [Paramecium tetraurelia]CAK82110.1 unnamed protein product [Paramecium tetraurelia]|eukprot:XP_001449507.1 hypothetical protein (macronuclear) [Paramecium tetraurelia strain d4-2]